MESSQSFSGKRPLCPGASHASPPPPRVFTTNLEETQATFRRTRKRARGERECSPCGQSPSMERDPGQVSGVHTKAVQRAAWGDCLPPPSLCKFISLGRTHGGRPTAALWSPNSNRPQSWGLRLSSCYIETFTCCFFEFVFCK